MEIIIILLLLIIAAEVSYLVAVNTKKLSHKKETKPIFVDTSVLIDGRIIAVAQSGFVVSKLSIPRSVIGELQFLADHSDTEKRGRARHGLDVVTELQAMPDVNVEIFQDGSRAEEGVDERLLKLAKQYQGMICTIDYNLNKVAKVEGITVLNVNDLAMSLRMAYLPGEKMLLELTGKGQDSHQAVGHLTDGTMVVVEHANGLIGKTVEIEFIRSLQTAAGKMMFAKTTKSFVKPVEMNKPVEIVKKQNNHRRRPAVVTAIAPTVTPSSVVVQPTPVVATVFHSDNNDQRLANRNKHKKQYRKRNNKPNSSASHEQGLIDLVNKQ